MLRKSLLLAAILSFLTAPQAAKADDVGLFFRKPADVGAPVVNKTMVVDPTDGALKVYGSLGWANKTLPQAALDASTAPTINDDSGDGYSIGSFWFDSVSGQFYVCTDATLGAASWALITSGTVSPTDLTNATKTKLTTADIFSDFKVSGFGSTDPGAVLAMTTPSGVAYAGGVRVSYGSNAHTYTASKDTYDYLQSDGTTNHIAVNNGASAPTGQPGLLLQKVVTNGTEITAVTTLAPATPTFSVGTATLSTDALGLGQANTLYAPISFTTSKTQAYVYCVQDSADGVPNFRLLTNGHLPVVNVAHGGMGTAVTPNALGLYYSNGTTGALVSAPAAAFSIPITNSGNTGWEYITKDDLATYIGGGGGGGGSDESFFGGGGTETGLTQGTGTFIHPFTTDNTTFLIDTGNTVDYASGTVINANSTITVTGTLNVTASAAGGVGTSDKSSMEPGGGVNGGHVGRVVDVAAGGVGGGCGGHGGNGGSVTSGTIGGLGGQAFAEGDAYLLRGLTGSGGAAGEAGTGAGGDGGKGGGFLALNAVGSILVDGVINAKGANGSAGTTQAGGGGAGSGGVVEIASQASITITGTVNVSGGNGGAGAGSTDGGGGAGGGGIVILIAPSVDFSGGTITLSHGTAGTHGTQTASAGTDGFILEIDVTPNEPINLIHGSGGAFLLDEARKERLATGAKIIRWDAAKYHALMKKALTMRSAG